MQFSKDLDIVGPKATYEPLIAANEIKWRIFIGILCGRAGLIEHVSNSCNRQTKGLTFFKTSAMVISVSRTIA